MGLLINVTECKIVLLSFYVVIISGLDEEQTYVAKEILNENITTVTGYCELR
jgi:hypothetical protein